MSTYNQKRGVVKRRLRSAYKEEGLRHIQLLMNYSNNFRDGDFRGLSAEDFSALCQEIIDEVVGD